MPCVNMPLNGSSMSIWPVAFIARVKNREYSRCRIACSTPPIYWSTGSMRSTTLRVVGAAAFHGSVKRAKYHDESTKVSMVSVSRRASPPHCGHLTCFHVGWWSSALPGLSNETSSGSATGRSWSGTGTTPQAGQWIIGIGQPQ